MTFVLPISAALALAAAPPQPPISAAERLAAARAAGFEVQGGQVRNACGPAEGLTVARQDLNGDGLAEMVVSDEGGCYGAAGAMFVVLRQTGAAWRPVLSAQGMMGVLRTRHGGWADIEIGGPGLGKMPVARWTGTRYAY